VSAVESHFSPSTPSYIRVHPCSSVASILSLSILPLLPLCLSVSVIQSVESADGPTFSRDVAPIIFHHCSSCHRSGQSGPFPLLNYRDVQKRAKQIAMVTQRRFMPPWLPADVEHGVPFVGSRRLSDEQIELIQRWVEADTPEGEPQDLPPLPEFNDGWALGDPDLVLTLNDPFTVPAQGDNVIQVFVLPVNLPEDRWISAVEFRPGNPQLVHHASFLVDTTGSALMMDAASPGPGYPGMGNIGLKQVGSFGGWTPGVSIRPLPPGMARLLPRHCDLVVEVHFGPSGKEEIEEPAIGLHFAPEPVTHPVTAITLGSFLLDIPAGQNDYTVRDEFTTPVPLQLLAIRPHAHYLCQKMMITATLPASDEEQPKTVMLLRVDDWDFNWQQVWQLTSPLELPAMTKLELEFIYDNTAANPQNPFNPPRVVRDGHGITDEMAQVFLHVTPAEPGDLEKLEDAYRRKLLERMRHDQSRRIIYQAQPEVNETGSAVSPPAQVSPRP